MKAADAFFAALPRHRPDAQALAHARLVAHRGAHGPGCPENTLKAFDAARDAGLWGLELDLRWSGDREPVVLHDANCQRVFDRPCTPAQMKLEELRRAVPDVPSLEEVIARYGGRMHLMIEIKDEFYPDPQYQSQRLAALLSSLEPVRDYHLLALDPALFSRFKWLQPSACIPVAQANVKRLSALTLEHGYGAFAGHYLLLGQHLLKRHHAAGQRVGVGFPASRNGLLREINRGVDWVFTNHAAKLQRYLDDWTGLG